MQKYIFVQKEQVTSPTGPKNNHFKTAIQLTDGLVVAVVAFVIRIEKPELPIE